MKVFFAYFQENHSSKHVGEYYTIPPKNVSTLFAHGMPKPAFLDEVYEFDLLLLKKTSSVANTISFY